MTDHNLVSALRLLGINPLVTNPTESAATNLSGDNPPSSAPLILSALSESDDTSSTTSSAVSGEPQLSRAELLRVSHHLVDGLLRVQSKAPSATPSYLSMVLPSLFKLLDDANQDVRIAADEGINKLLKLLRVSMTHQVICELFLELKRNQNARSVSAALAKFAALVHRIRTPKRRFYTSNLLPVLVAICKRKEESVFVALLEHFPTIASHLFCYATERELREFLAEQLPRLSSDTALVRRAMAQLLVHTCEYSRVPLTLLRGLLQHILCKLNENSELSASATALHHAGLLNALRHLSTAWQQVVSANPGVSRSEVDGQSAAAAARTNPTSLNRNAMVISTPPIDDSPSEIFNQSPSQTGDSLEFPPTVLPNSTEIEQQHLWSLAFFTCLDRLSDSSLVVVTASLETLLQLLTTRRPLLLYPRRWLERHGDPLMDTTCESGFVPPRNPKDGIKVEDPSDSQLRDLTSTDTLRPDMSPVQADSPTSLHQPPEFPDTEETAVQPHLPHASSTTSLASSIGDGQSTVELGLVQVHQQLSAVRTRLARTEQLLVADSSPIESGAAQRQGTTPSDEDYSLVDSNIRSSDHSIVHVKSSSPDSINDASSVGEQGPQNRLLTLAELLTRLSRSDDAISLGDSVNWLLPYMVVQFGLVAPGTAVNMPVQVRVRTSSQLLAITCLSRIVYANPTEFLQPLFFSRCCEVPCSEDFPVAADALIDMARTHTDPQLRGQIYQLIGQLIAAYLVLQGLQPPIDNSDDDDIDKVSDDRRLLRLLQTLDLALETEDSGTTFRLVLSGLRSCSNLLLTTPIANTTLDVRGDMLVRPLMGCLARHLVPAARHAYRLVRREFLLLVQELNWTAVNYLDLNASEPAGAEPSACLTKPTRLFDLVWLETWRILADSDPELRDLAASVLTNTLASTLNSSNAIRRSSRTDHLLSSSLERRLHIWHANTFSGARLPVLSYGLVNSWTSQSLPPCLSGLSNELDVGPVGLQTCPDYARLLYVESKEERGASEGSSTSCGSLGPTRLFQQCLTALVELPCASLLPDDRFMVLGVTRCLNRLIGQAHILAHSELWFDPPTVVSTKGVKEQLSNDATATNRTDDDDDAGPSSSTQQGMQQPPPPPRRPRIVLLAWQCLTMLTATPMTTTDLDLHVELLRLCSGCLTRWALHALTQGSIATGSRALSLDLTHSYTRFALSLLHHVARVLYILWHVVEELKPSPVPTGALHADPLNPDQSTSIAQSITQMSTTSGMGGNQPQSSVTSSATGDKMGIGNSAVTQPQRRPLSMKLTSPLKKSQTESTPIEIRRMLGYFSHLPHYMALYQTLKTAFQTYKISPDLTGAHDHVMQFLQSYLHTLGRLMGHLRLAETAPYSDELLTYMAVLYHWQPAVCLEASTQMMRAFVGTNLISHWDDKLSQLYNTMLHPGLVSTSAKPGGKEASRDSAGPIDKLYARTAHYHQLLTNPTARIGSVATWLGFDQLSRTPITAWIRFARQWRVPLPLTSKAPAIKTELAQFFKRFEHIIVQSMEGYNWTNCIPLQSSILNLLTHLICLKLNYDQLDTGQYFLQAVLRHCEHLPLEAQRQYHSGPTINTISLTNRKQPRTGTRTNERSPSGNSLSNNSQPLVIAMFRFLVSLSHHKSVAVPSSETSTTASRAKTEHRSIDFSQVIHMAETLAADGMDSGFIVLSALVPIVVDLFVIQRPLLSSEISVQRLDEYRSDPALQQIEVKREAVLSFLLRRLIHLPACYDQLCLIVEEACLLPSSVAPEFQAERLRRTITQIVHAVLGNLVAGATQLTTCNDLDALFRLFDHVVLTLTSTQSIDPSLVGSIVTTVNGVRQLPSTEASLTLLTADLTAPALARLTRWAVLQVGTTRMLMQLARLAPSLLSSLLKQDVLPFHVLLRLTRTLRHLLTEHPWLAAQLANTCPDRKTLSSGSIVWLLCQLIASHLLTLVELHTLGDQTGDEKHGANLGTTISHVMNEIDQQLVLLGIYEPSLTTLWYRLRRVLQLPNSSSSSAPQSNSSLSSALLPDGIYVNVDLLTRAEMECYLDRAMHLDYKCLDILNTLLTTDKQTDVINAKYVKRIFSLWHSQTLRIEALFHKVCQCPEASLLFLTRFQHAIPSLTLADLRLFLQFFSKHVHPNLVGQHIALLWDHFISPRPVMTHSTGQHCPTCRRNPLPLGLQVLAIHETCRLLRMDANRFAECFTSSLTLANLMEYASRVPRIKALQTHTKVLSECLKRAATTRQTDSEETLFSTPSETMMGDLATPADSTTVLDIPAVISQVERGASSWLLDLIPSLLQTNSSPQTVIRLLLHTMSVTAESVDSVTERRVTAILQDSCARCHPRLLRDIIVLTPTPIRPACSPAVHVTTGEGGRGALNTTPATGSALFRIAQKLLVERIQQVITDPTQFFISYKDPTLRYSIQSYLTGLSSALVYLLQISPQLPAMEVNAMEIESMALEFLSFSINFIFHLFGHGTVEHGKSRPTASPLHPSPEGRRVAVPCSVALMRLTLDLLHHLTETIAAHWARGVDILGDRAPVQLTLFVRFIKMIDQSAGISEPLNFWTLGQTDKASSSSQPMTNSYLANLLTPSSPSLFASWHPDPLPASVIGSFNQVAATASAGTVLSGMGDGDCDNRSTSLSQLIAAHLAPCQLVNKSRLLRSGCLSAMRNDPVASKLVQCLIGCLRLHHHKQLPVDESAGQYTSGTANQPSQPPSSPTDAASLVGLEPDSLAVAVTQTGAWGWLVRRQFEHLWMNYLELLAQSSHTVTDHHVANATAFEGPPPMEGIDFESIERFQCVELGLHGLTRLLLDATLRPHPGDPVHSVLHHQPRSSAPHFSYTRLGRKLAALINTIEAEYSRLDDSDRPPRLYMTTEEFTTETRSLADSPVRMTAATGAEPNLERLGDAPNQPGPSQLSIFWLVRRLMPSTDLSSSEEGFVDVTDVGGQTLASRSPIPTPRPWRTTSSGDLPVEYEDLLFSCLQSTQLLYQSWTSSTSSTEEPKTPTPSSNTISKDIFMTTSVELVPTTNMPTKASSSSSNPSRHSNERGTSSKGLPLAITSALVRSSVILSDLFTAREQFEWLHLFLKETLTKLPSLNEFPAPIHLWLTLGLAKCTAVLEMARSSNNNSTTHPSPSTHLEPAVRQARLALQSLEPAMQDAGLHASMWLLHAAILIRAQPHQRQVQQHSPPTGFPLLNGLYTQVYTFVECQLGALFPAPPPPFRLSSTDEAASSAESTNAADPLKQSATSMPAMEKLATGTSGLRRFVAGVFGARGTHVTAATVETATDSGSTASAMLSGSGTSTGRVERHQLTVLAAAVFLAEHFSAPPIYAVQLNDLGVGQTEMLSGLTASLFQLASPMLSDRASSPLLLPRQTFNDKIGSRKGNATSKFNLYAQLSAGTTASLTCSLPVHTAWCRGIARLVLIGRLGKGATESLQKLCVARLRMCRSPRIALPILRLLITCMYSNTTRLNSQMQHYRPGRSMDSNIPVQTDDDSAQIPQALLQDAEATASMTQEFLSCLWERLRGGVAPIHTAVLPPTPTPAAAYHQQLGNSATLGSPTFPETWAHSAWTSAAEASIVARLLPATSMDIVQALFGSLTGGSTAGEGEGFADPVLNKALGEFARLDHAHPQLAAQTLAKLFGMCLDNPSGQSLVRQWVLLSLPTLLNRQPRRLAVWATTICLLAAALQPCLRAALPLCSIQQSTHHSPIDGASTPAVVPPLWSDLLCLAAFHFVHSGLLKRIPGDDAPARRRTDQRLAFLNMFKLLLTNASPPPSVNTSPMRHDTVVVDDDETFQRVYCLVRKEVGFETPVPMEVVQSLPA